MPSHYNLPIQQFDLGNVFSQAAGIQNVLQRNALIKQEADRQSRAAALTPGAIAGEERALDELFAVDPDLASKLDERQRKVAKENAETMGKLLFSVEQAPPDQRQAAWEGAVAQAAEWGVDVSRVPRQYDPQFSRLMLARVAQIDKMLEEAGPISAPGKVQRDIQRGFLPPGTPVRGEGVTVNVGSGFPKEPQGFVYKRAPDGSVILDENGSPVLVPITGGPAAREIEEKASAAEIQQQQQATQARIVVEDIDRALGIVSAATIPVTGTGSFLAVIPGTPARDLSSLVDTIRANVGFEKLQQMRKASPTGGALGQVSENENRLLQSVLGSLDQSQSQEQFTYNMRRLKDTFLDIVHGPGNRPGQEPQGQFREGDTATNPQTGERLIFRNGQWQPMQ